MRMRPFHLALLFHRNRICRQLTKPPVIDTYTAYINHWKHAKEAVKTACQAKSAFAKFLGVSRSIIATLLLIGVLRRCLVLIGIPGPHRPYRMLPPCLVAFSYPRRRL